MTLLQLFADDIRALRQGTADLAAGSERERIARLAERATRSPLLVLIESEPGSGAQALARAIHECGERRSRSFIHLNAGEAFHPTGEARAALARALRDANGGTLFIQDVDALSKDAQGGLLEALNHQDAPSRNGRRLDVRVIAASSPNLADRVRAGSFREDLYYRLQVLPISLRPLRAQRDSIHEWASLFLNRLAADEGRRVRGLSADAAALLARYDWPGNLRQLENVVYRAVILAEGPFLTPTEFPQIAAHTEGFRVEIPPLPTARTLAPAVVDKPADGHDPHALSLIGATGEMRTLAELEEQAIRFALVHYQGHMSAISRHLGIGRSTLYRKLKELGLSDEAA